jgi:hypothetical protein
VSIEPEEIDDLDEAEEIIDFTYSITSYGADYPVDSLVKRLNDGNILVPVFNWKKPKSAEVVGFQRDYIWPRSKADRFLESLLLGLPVPGIFLVKESTGVLLVLDGHQRLHTIHAFYSGLIASKEYRLSGVQPRFEGKTYAELDADDRRRLDDSIIHATIIRQDLPTEDQSSVYVIFERLNTGGVTLQPQEVRVALYHGELVQLLVELNDYPTWRALIGPKSKHLKDMELVLRFFAFVYYADRYKSPMKDFLNRYIATNRHLKHQSKKVLKKIFMDTTDTILKSIGESAFRPIRTVNAAVVDSLMVAVASRLLKKGPITNDKDMARRYEKLLQNGSYASSIETGTAQEVNVRERLRIAEAAFKAVA